jgi:hypothetical protein
MNTSAEWKRLGNARKNDMECLALLLLMVVPVVIGVRLLILAVPLAVFAGWLTLKPAITTPIWFLILASMGNTREWHPAYLLGNVPGLGLSLLILFVSWPIFTSTTAHVARALFCLDCLRELNTLLLVASEAAHYPTWAPSSITLVVISIFAPMLYALLAAEIVRRQNRQRPTTVGSGS